METPDVLYHGSANKHIENFEPRRESVRDPEEGPVVFGTPHKAFASMFLVDSDGSWSDKKGCFDGVYYTVISDRERFRKIDKGGSIYILPTETFQCDLKRGMKDKEWTSKVSVKPVEKIDYNSGLEAMIQNGVKVYFVDKDTFDKIKKAKDHGFKILQNLKPEAL